MTPEERNRIITDAQGEFHFAKKPDAMTDLSNRLDAITMIVQGQVQREIATHGFVRDQPTLVNKIADTYLDHFKQFSREELEILLAAVLAASAVARFR